jgi:NTP pyrophosphatase (non-canonical NTP hydrolase)
MMVWEILQGLENLNMKGYSIKFRDDEFMEYEELQEKVIEWAESKGIFEKSTPIKQIGKTQEELLETFHALIVYDLVSLKHKLDNVEDGIGDMLVTIIILAKMVGLDSVKCLDTAYNVIKNRKGKMVNGLFVKEE